MTNQKDLNHGNHHLRDAVPHGIHQPPTARCKITVEVLTPMNTMKYLTKVHQKEEKLSLKDTIV